ncbi:hypothetical protein D9756_004933 [Leucocoprinus leucothites]|uniref:Uncharacterized protein n=1 Tax=Leucocoprinus leucothites TaxID=201217 RepID=A0A8H5LKD7_9AGAR|nr:hypothetical protein D9756_004933 [Leucoagaricus leucothites]
MNSDNVSKSVSTTKTAGYTKTVIGKDMTPQKSSSSPADTTSPGQSSSSTSGSQDSNPSSSTGFAKMAKDKGLPFTSPVRPSF